MNLNFMFQREFRERIQQQKFAQNKLQEQRQQFARAKKYYSIYHVQLHARLMQAKTQEERVSAKSTCTSTWLLRCCGWLIGGCYGNLGGC